MRPNHRLELYVLNFKALNAKGSHAKALKFLQKNQSVFVDQL